jgi:hypothetical protein
VFTKDDHYSLSKENHNKFKVNMSRGRPRQPVSEDKLIRKRLAAKLRQRRCRERKKGIVKMETNAKNVSHPIADDSVTKGNHSVPPSPPCKLKIVHVPVPTYFGLPPYQSHPMYMPHPISAPGSHHPHHRPLDPRAHPGYAVHAPYYHPVYPMMPYPHRSTVRSGPYTAATTSAQSDTIPRTVSRSSSDASTDDSVITSDMRLSKHEPKKQKKSLASEEKTAVDAILSLKSNSSDDESSDETISTTDEGLSLASNSMEEHSTIIQCVDNAQSVFRAVSV